MHTYSPLPFIIFQGVLVLVVICAGVSASLLSSITFFDDEAERLRYWGNAAAIYTVVVSIISLILEGAILIIRFFDINSIIFHIVVSMDRYAHTICLL